MKRLITFLSLLAAVVFGGAGYPMWRMFEDHEVYLTGLAHYEGLPPEASDIRVYRNDNISGNFCADFAIPEEAFRTFASARGWKLAEIAGEETIRHAAAMHAGRLNKFHRISRGLRWSEHASNGSGTTVAYDRGTGRGWIDSSAR